MEKTLQQLDSFGMSISNLKQSGRLTTLPTIPPVNILCFSTLMVFKAIFDIEKQGQERRNWYSQLLNTTTCSTAVIIADYPVLPADMPQHESDQLLKWLIHYENSVTEWWSNMPVKAFCMYYKPAFPSAFIAAVERIHPCAVIE